MPSFNASPYRAGVGEYGLAAAGVVAAAGLRLLLDPVLGDAHPFLVFVFPVLVMANRAGWRPGVAALVLGTLVADFLFVSPRYKIGFAGPAHAVGTALFLAVGGAGVYLADACRKALARAGEAAHAAEAEAAAHRVTQDAFRAQQARLLDHAFDPILTWELGGAITYWNAGAERLYGYTAAEAVGRVSHDLLRTEFPIGAAECEAGLRRDGFWAGELRHRTRDGRWVPVDSRMTVVRGAAGPPEVLEANRDVSERKRAEDAQRWLAAVVESSNDAVISKTLDGVIRTWNAGAERIFGYSAEEAIGRPVTLIIPPELLSEEGMILERIRRGERIAHYETVRVAKDGHRVTVSLSVSPVRDARGHVAGASKVLRDVTEQRLAEAALRASEERFRNLVEQASDGFFLFGDDGAVLDVNRRACESLGYAREELVGTRADAIDPGLTPEEFRRVRREVAAGREVTRETVHRRRDGTTFPVEARLGPFEVSGRRVALALVRDVTDRRRAEQALRMRDRAIRAVNQGILITDPVGPDNPVVYVSPGFERLTGYPEGETLGRNCRFLQGADTDRGAVAVLREAVREGRECEVELLNYRKDGTPFWNALSVTPVRDEAGAITQFVGVLADVTERRKLEAQYRQSQKMEAVGRLAGGIAHDFNNLLTVINGFSELALVGLPAADPLAETIRLIKNSGERAAVLTRQLLAFSRQQVLQPAVLDLDEVLADMGKMLERVIGEDIGLTVLKTPRLWRVRADPGQVEQVVMNLVVNARDAMPTGGRLTIETANTTLDAGYSAAHPETRPGQYVRLAVTDTGHGMDQPTLARAFEPFFSTKGELGTGLGLATVFGIVKQSGGQIEVYSEVGVGTTFKIYLPRDQTTPTGESGEVRLKTPRRGTETVLLAEDEDGVRALAKLALERHGYTVLEARNGREAIEICEAREGDIDLLVTDVVMPGLSGRQVAERLRAVRSGLRVLYLSGYTDDTIVRHGVLEADVAFLQKPFSPASLARKVREVLDG